ncbi:GNAT family N-acetyltransferase [Solitalea lacus]|uniref:GNAT family N-acetyltransferase n=1 Tax=Solitalea lacus TaxID=2911172 RepID=UPI001EDBD23D|nr:GNAT family N-acetyltransferase [Solitalea lacus]UKJ09296.1 GNAT family N-acetyltransferase [Solitalea lacus]
MTYREAKFQDIQQIQFVRNSVKENILSNPGLVTDEDCNQYLFNRGKGWVCEINTKIIGFAIADLVNNNIWALFLHPEFEGRGIGKTLHNLMLNWYFEQNKEDVWLGTAPNTRAEQFYIKMGWRKNGIHGKEVRFELTKTEWSNLNK